MFFLHSLKLAAVGSFVYCLRYHLGKRDLGKVYIERVYYIQHSTTLFPYHLFYFSGSCAYSVISLASDREHPASAVTESV